MRRKPGDQSKNLVKALTSTCKHRKKLPRYMIDHLNKATQSLWASLSGGICEGKNSKIKHGKLLAKPSHAPKEEDGQRERERPDMSIAHPSTVDAKKNKKQKTIATIKVAIV